MRSYLRQLANRLGTSDASLFRLSLRTNQKHIFLEQVDNFSFPIFQLRVFYPAEPLSSGNHQVNLNNEKEKFIKQIKMIKKEEITQQKEEIKLTLWQKIKKVLMG